MLSPSGFLDFRFKKLCGEEGGVFPFQPVTHGHPFFFVHRCEFIKARPFTLHKVSFFCRRNMSKLIYAPCPSTFCSRPHYNHCTELRERETRTRSAKNTGWIRMKNTANVQLRFHTECTSYTRSNENSVYFFDNNTLCLHLPLAFFACNGGGRREEEGVGRTKKSLFLFLPSASPVLIAL